MNIRIVLALIVFALCLWGIAWGVDTHGMNYSGTIYLDETEHTQFVEDITSPKVNILDIEVLTTVNSIQFEHLDNYKYE